MPLANTQTDFTNGLRSDCTTDQTRRALQLLRENARIPAELALRIYANNARGAYLESLAVVYPACLRILGESCFNSIAYRYIETTASNQPDLNRYGSALCDFMDDLIATQAAFSDYLYLGDLARLEWLCHRAYYAEDDPPFDFGILTNTAIGTQKTLCFRLGHSIGLLQSDFPVEKIRQHNLVADDASEVKATEVPEYLVVSRTNTLTRIDPVDATVFMLLVNCQQGKSLGDIIDAGAAQAKAIVTLLPQLIQQGWLTGITAAPAHREGAR